MTRASAGESAHTVPALRRRVRRALGVLAFALLASLALLPPAPAEAQPPSAPTLTGTGFTGLTSVIDQPVGSGTAVTYNKPVSGTWEASIPLRSNRRIQSLFPAGGDVSCAAGTTAEYGWYKSTALTTRVGVAGSGILRFDPTTAGEYRALAYCKVGTTYSTALNLMGTGGKVTLARPAAPTLTGAGFTGLTSVIDNPTGSGTAVGTGSIFPGR